MILGKRKKRARMIQLFLPSHCLLTTTTPEKMQEFCSVGVFSTMNDGMNGNAGRRNMICDSLTSSAEEEKKCACRFPCF